MEITVYQKYIKMCLQNLAKVMIHVYQDILQCKKQQNFNRGC